MTEFICPACKSAVEEHPVASYAECKECGCVFNPQHAKKVNENLLEETQEVFKEKYAHIATCDDDCKNPSCLDQNECEHEYRRLGVGGYSDCIKCKCAKNHDLATAEEFPKDGDTYWTVFCDGDMDTYEWEGGKRDRGCKEIGNVHRTKEDAEMYRLRLESLAVRQTRTKGQKFWTWSLHHGYVEERSARDGLRFAMQLKFAKRSEAAEWGKKYAKAWEEWNSQHR